MPRCIYFFGQLLLMSSSQPVQNTGLVSFCGFSLFRVLALIAPRSCCFTRSPPCLFPGPRCHPPVTHDGLAELPEFIPALVLGGHRGDQIAHVYLPAQSLHLHCRLTHIKRGNNSIICRRHGTISYPCRPGNCLIHSPAKSRLHGKVVPKMRL